MVEQEEVMDGRNPKAAEEVAVMARVVHLSVPEPCLPGVIGNTELLNTYVDLVLGFDLPDDCAPAYEYTP